MLVCFWAGKEPTIDTWVLYDKKYLFDTLDAAMIENIVFYSMCIFERQTQRMSCETYRKRN